MRSLKNMIDQCKNKTSSMNVGGKAYHEPKVKFGEGKATSSKGASSSTGKTKMHFWNPGESDRGL